MRDGASREDDSTLTASAFDHLLATLDPDRDRAGDKYELIRRKLLTFFECRASSQPEDDADETLRRVARKLEQGERIENLPAYSLGVARFVLLETSRHRRKEQAMLENTVVGPPPQGSTVETERLACLERCLATLPAKHRELLLSYYEEGEHGLIWRRHELAKSHGIPMNALRIRVHRLRAAMEACVKQCMLESVR
jgi:DNA-directed RNA polymerase specialized sigma24 family protein